jgi:hypothetical protein
MRQKENRPINALKERGIEAAIFFFDDPAREENKIIGGGRKPPLRSEHSSH